MAYELKDYREVPERIAEWYTRYEHGRIVCTVLEKPNEWCNRWTVKAEVYRTEDPTEPPAGVGHSFLVVPGKTSFTRDSELENAETSAAGRALVMAGIPAKNVASEGEVRAKSQAVEPGSTVTSSPEATGMAAKDEAGADGEAAPASTPSTEDRKLMREFLGSKYGTDQAILMARQLFQTQARKVPNLMGLDVDELAQIDAEFRARAQAVSA